MALDSPPDVIGQIMGAVLDCAEQKLDHYDRSCGRVLIAPGGPPAWDACCDGFLYVRLITMFPTAGQSSPFPAPDLRPTNCSPNLMASTLGVGVLRCASVVDANGKAPAPEVLTAEALGVTRDASILLEALKCCVTPLAGEQGSLIEQSVIGSWLPSGPEGGCVGGEWAFTVGHGSCGCP